MSQRQEAVEREKRVAAAMGGQAFGPMPKSSVVPLTRPPARVAAGAPTPPALREGDVDLGQLDSGGAIGLSLAALLEGRLLVQGASGAGKSWTLRRLLEQTAGKIQQIVIDPEGEFRSFAEKFELLVVDGGRLDDAALRQAASRAREHRLSLLLDLSDCEREEQMRSFSAFVRALVEAPREHWHPCLVAVDEAHLFAPFGGDLLVASSIRKGAIGALVSLMSRGRKRGLAGLIATQRLARLSKSVSSEALNFLVGINTLDLDIRRAAETIGWDSRRAFDRLPMFSPGEFAAVGPAFSRSPAVLKIGGVETEHRGTPLPGFAVFLAPGEAAKLMDLDGLIEESAADQALRDEGEQLPGLKAARALIRDPAFSAAGAIFAALKPLWPEGAAAKEIAPALSLSADACNAAIALLDQFGMIELQGHGDVAIVRIEKSQAQVMELRRPGAENP